MTKLLNFNITVVYSSDDEIPNIGENITLRSVHDVKESIQKYIDIKLSKRITGEWCSLIMAFKEEK